MGEQTASLSQRRSMCPPSPAASVCSGGIVAISMTEHSQVDSMLLLSSSAAISSRVEPGGIMMGSFAQASGVLGVHSALAYGVLSSLATLTATTALDEAGNRCDNALKSARALAHRLSAMSDTTTTLAARDTGNAVWYLAR